uniref:Putative Erf family protein n=1 Tax=viral metagenome TaxID=1070528 RepID=A0A6M3JKV4_9ZZZZ
MTEEIKVYDKRMSHEIIPHVEQPTSIVMAAISKGYDPAFIEKMMDLAERNEKTEARKAFYNAVADFKKKPPEVLKDKENTQFSKGDKKAMYVSLGNLVKTINPALGEHGLSASWEIEQAEKIIKVTCRLSHRFGHSEAVTMEAPPDTSGGNSKTPIQQIKSTVTYLKAATFESVTGLAASDANLDDDGNLSGNVEYIDEKQQAAITDLLTTTESDVPKFLVFMKVESIDQIKKADYNKAIAPLNTKLSKMTDDQVKRIVKIGAEFQLSLSETNEVINFYIKNNQYGDTYRAGQALIFGFSTILDRFLESREKSDDN